MKGLRCIVTGAGTGLGKATALLLGERGASVVVVGLDRSAGESTVNEISAAKGRAIYVQADISQEEDCKRMVRTAVGQFGGLDCAVNNAAIIMPPEKLHLKALNDWSRVIAVNLTGTFLCMKYEIAAMLNSGKGAIVNVSSVSGVRGYDCSCDYGSSKGGLISLSQHAAAEYGRNNIRVNALLPGPMLTPMMKQASKGFDGVADSAVRMTMLGRAGETSEVAEAAAWLISDAASYVTGACLGADGGMAAAAIPYP